MLKAKELRDQSAEELELMYHDTMHELFELVNQAKLEKPEKPHLIWQKKKLVARLLTVMNEKKAG